MAQQFGYGLTDCQLLNFQLFIPNLGGRGSVFPKLRVTMHPSTLLCSSLHREKDSRVHCFLSCPDNLLSTSKLFLLSSLRSHNNLEPTTTHTGNVMTPFNRENPAKSGGSRGRAGIKGSAVTLGLLLVPDAEASSLRWKCHQLCK